MITQSIAQALYTQKKELLSATITNNKGNEGQKAKRG